MGAEDEGLLSSGPLQKSPSGGNRFFGKRVEGAIPPRAGHLDRMADRIDHVQQPVLARGDGQGDVVGPVAGRVDSLKARQKFRIEFDQVNPTLDQG
jgi:hypothetical protein